VVAHRSDDVNERNSSLSALSFDLNSVGIGLRMFVARCGHRDHKIMRRVRRTKLGIVCVHLEEAPRICAGSETQDR